MRSFRFKSGRMVPKLEAQIVGEELDRICEAAGELTPKAIVDESRPKNAVLHPVFEWKDNVAGELWRLHQARNIANVVECVVEEGKDTMAPAFVNVVEGSVDDPESRHYKPIHDVLADPQQRAELVQRALDKLVRVQREFRHLRELANIWGAIDELVLSGQPG